MTLALVMGLVVFYGISLQATILALRDPRPATRVHTAVWAATSFTIGSVLLTAFFVVEGGKEISTPAFAADTRLLLVAAGMLFLGAAGSGIAWVRRHKLVKQNPSVHRSPVTIKQRLRFVYSLSQANWKNLSAPKYALEDHQETATFARLLSIGATLVLFPTVAVLLSAAILVNVRESQTSDFAAQTLGYFILLVATSWTIVFLLTLLFLAVQQLLRNQSHDLSLSAVVVAVGTWAGFGAAGGVFVGALIPAVVVLIPTGPFQKLDMILLDTVSAELLLNISASGAVIGFILGLVVSLLSYAQGEENLFYRVVVPPVVFGALATVLGFLGLRPGALSTRLAHSYEEREALASTPGAADPLDIARGVDLSTSQGWGALIKSFQSAGWNHAVDTHFYYWGTWLVVILTVLFGYTLSVYKRELALAEAHTSSDPNPDNGPSN